MLILQGGKETTLGKGGNTHFAMGLTESESDPRVELALVSDHFVDIRSYFSTARL